ncbi:MAG: FtsX-like permease family protein [Candidatus Omnitrophica bacterium]|nr:FtsX-like permease family protein [Candidatus Omnitrophota bacterium]
MAYEFWLGLRYLLRRRRERFVSIIALLSIGGVALGVTALLVVLAVMSGFDHDLKDKLVAANSHLTVEAEGGISDVEPLIQQIAGTEHVVGVSPYVTGQAIVRLSDRAFGVLVRGLDVQREVRVSKLQDYLVMGGLPSREQDVVIGSELASVIQARPGGALRLISPADGKLHELVVSGIFRSGLYEYDSSLVCVTIERAQRLFGRVKTVSGLSVRLDSLDYAVAVKARLQEALGPVYIVRTWMELNPILFGALHLEKLTMFVILTLIVAVGALNIVSMLIMSVMEKTKDIGILRSLGATRSSVASLFLYQGCLVGIVGIGLGLFSGLLLANNLNAIARWLEEMFGISIFPPSIYYLDHIPAQINGSDVVWIVGSAFVLTVLASIYPASRAARLVPVEALRYE